jgi:hypothetical protein
MSSPLRPLVRVLSAACVLGLALCLAACDGSDEDRGTEVNVTLDEFTINLDRTVAPDGRVTFDVTNQGTVTHEFMVIRTNLLPANLPTNPDGSYDENAGSTTVVDEIDDLTPGENDELTLNLSSGNYVLICNMVAGGNSHYALGMRTSFTVD